MPKLAGLPVPLLPGCDLKQTANQFEQLGLDVKWVDGYPLVFLSQGSKADEEDRPGQVKRLKRWSWVVVVWLTVVILGCSTAIVLVYADGNVDRKKLVILSILAGGLGSAIAAITSAADRVAHGWELEKGTKDPADGKADRFVRRMVPMFLMRPFLGAGTGLVVYFGVIGGLIFTTAESVKPRAEGVLFFAAVSGLFAKSLVDRLKQAFDFFLGLKG